MYKNRYLIIISFILLLSTAAFAQLNESFTDTQFPPDGWTRYNFGTTVDDSWVRYTTYYNSSPACAQIYYDLPNNDWLITPRLRKTGTNDSLIFWWRVHTASTSYVETLLVRLSTNPNVADTGQYTVIGILTQTNNTTWWRAAFDLSSYSDTFFIAFQYKNNNCWGIAIDDVTGPPILTFPNDVGVKQILSPGLQHMVNQPMTPSAKIKNYGTNNQNNFAVRCSIIGNTSGYLYSDVRTISLASGRETTITFNSWTPTTTELCTVYVRTMLIDDNPFNNRKKSPCDISQHIIIGTGTSGSSTYCMYGYYAYSGSNAIYLQSEIGYYGPISHVAYYKTAGTATSGFDDVRIYMRHSTATQITSADALDTTGFMRVYQGTFPIDAVGWMDVALNTPFVYNNTDNLEVMVLKFPPAITTGYPSFAYTTTATYMNRYGYNASTVPPTTYLALYRPNIRLLLAPTTPPTRDVGVSQILSPGAWQFPNIAIYPTARIRNYGSASQTFPVVCSIVNRAGTTRYTNTQNITLGVAGDTNLVFGSWTPTVLETLTVIIRTNLTNDTNPANNRLSTDTRIQNYAEIIIGTGTSASATYLMYGYDAYAGSEAIYLQPEIGYSGTITHLAYYKGGGTGLDNLPDVSIYMKLTSEASVATGAYDTTGYTCVFHDSFPNNQPGGWLDVTLSTPFIYNNQDNLKILILKGPPALASGVYPTYRYTTTSPTYLNRYGYNNTGWPIASFTQTYYRSNIRFYLTPTPPPARDVGLKRIVAPGLIHLVNTPMAPIGLVQNYGSATQSFSVVCSIIGSGVVRYTNTQSVSALTPGDSVLVNFGSFTPTVFGEVESIIMRTLLANDTNPSNDRKLSIIGIAQYYQDFEATNGGYVPDPATAAWEWGTPTYISGPPSASSGTKCWGTVLAGPYATSANWKLTTSEFVAIANNPFFGFIHWYQFENRYDGGNVKISTDGGSTWTLLHPDGGYNDTAYTSNVGIPGESCYTSTLGAWTPALFPLTMTSGQHFYIRWHFGSDPSVTYAGWYVDDVFGIGFQPYTGSVAEDKPNSIMITTLYAPKPNPVTNGLAHISFSIATPSKTSLKVYNASGRLIKTLVNEKLINGTYNYIWNGTDNNSREVAEGIYFYTLQTDKQSFTKKLIFTR